MQQIKVAFVGNPNCGKTTLFNGYTGAKHKVGNWPGVTVEKKEGIIKHDGRVITLVDLPGIYSISPYSMEEILTREYILNYDPDIVVNIVDATNLERNLYLSLQLIELGKPVVIALNMMDLVESRGYHINIERLSEELGVPVVPVSAVNKKGLTRLIHQVINSTSTRKRKSYKPIIINYGDKIEEQIESYRKEIASKYPTHEEVLRWLAIKILENDKEIFKKIHLTKKPEKSHEEDIAKIKYDYISSFIGEVITTNDDELNFSDKVDNIIINSFWGIPIFAIIMTLVFAFTFTVGNFFMDVFDSGFGLFVEFMTNLLTNMHVAEWLVSLIVDGIIGGVGGILIFLPNIACLFLAISILEDSGYMARVALLMDKFMRRIGLNGKAFIPMILGFGCSVPAIMTARTLEEESDRLKTILITPFMSCSAKMPIYVLFSSLFFPGNEILITLSLYFIGIIVAILVAIVFKKTMAKGASAPLIMELPSYKKPAIKTTMIFVWEKIKGYLQKAGTIIFIASVILWFILEFNFTGKVDMVESFGASIGRFIAPIFTPLGFGNWQAALSLISGIMGKEIVVSSMAVIYGISESGFETALLTSGFTYVSAYAFMVFSLLYTPCVATIGIIKKETNSWKWTIFSFIYQLVIAWFVAMIVYQLGMLIFQP